MKLEITKACADSLRTFIQNNYGIQLKSSHAHELVAAYLGYSSRAALLADKAFPIDRLRNAEIIVLGGRTHFVEQRLKTLENLPAGLPSGDILVEGLCAAIIDSEDFSGKIWNDLQEVAIAYADNRAFEKLEMFGIDPIELDFLKSFELKVLETDMLMTVIYDFPARAKKPQRHSSVKVTLPRFAAGIGFGIPTVLPTFYAGHMVDPDYRLKHGID